MRWICLVAALWAGAAWPQSWQPDARQKEASVATVQAYFARFAEGAYEAARQMFLAPVAQRRTAGQIGEADADERARYGGIGGYTIRGVTWVPRGANVGTGVVAIVVFDARTSGDALVCGTATLVEMTPGVFVLYTIDRTVTPADIMRDADAATLQAVLGRPGCARFLSR